MKLRSPVISYRKAVTVARSLVEQLWNVNTLALVIAVIASKEECTFPAKRTVKEGGYVFTSARSLAQRIAHPVQRSVKTDAVIVDAQKPAWIYAHLVGLV